MRWFSRPFRCLLAAGTFAALGMTAPFAARADDFDCLAKTKNQSVRWDKSWQADSADHDIEYKVVAIDSSYKPGVSRQAVVSLVALGPAKVRERKAVITRQLGAVLFCKRASTAKRTGVLTAYGGADGRTVHAYEIAAVVRPTDVAPEDLSHRVLSGNAWVPARPSPGSARKVCLVKGTAYSCGEKDHAVVEDAYARGVSKPKPVTKAKLDRPLIRFNGTSWGISSPVDLAPDAAVLECKVGGEAYRCLADEKEKYKAELKLLEQEIAVEAKLSALAD